MRAAITLDGVVAFARGSRVQLTVTKARGHIGKITKLKFQRGGKVAKLSGRFLDLAELVVVRLVGHRMGDQGRAQALVDRLLGDDALGDVASRR